MICRRCHNKIPESYPIELIEAGLIECVDCLKQGLEEVDEYYDRILKNLPQITKAMTEFGEAVNDIGESILKEWRQRTSTLRP